MFVNMVNYPFPFGPRRKNHSCVKYTWKYFVLKKWHKVDFRLSWLIKRISRLTKVGRGDNLQLFISPLLKYEEWLCNIIDDTNFEINSLEPPCTGGLKIQHTPIIMIGTCQNAKNENFEFCFDCGKNVFQWTKKNHLGHLYGQIHRIWPVLAENRHPRLKVMLRGPKLWVSLILDVIGVRSRFMGTHFDHNRYIIRIFICWFFYRSLWNHAKVSDPLYGGVPGFIFSLIIVLICC